MNLLWLMCHVLYYIALCCVVFYYFVLFVFCLYVCLFGCLFVYFCTIVLFLLRLPGEVNDLYHMC